MKHTQGPWEIRATRIDDNAFISDIHAPHQDNPHFHRCGSHHSQSGSNPTVATTWYRPDDGEAKANARLIAAAPDLLECLQKWMSFQINSGLEGCDEIVVQTEKAIAKASRGKLS